MVLRNKWPRKSLELGDVLAVMAIDIPVQLSRKDFSDSIGKKVTDQN